MKSTITKIKQDGATFTPSKLAEFLAERIYSYLPSEDKVWRVCDPSCGNGSLLYAMSVLLSKHKTNFELFGVDNNEEYVNNTTRLLLNTFPNHLNSIEKKDFIEIRYDNELAHAIDFDIIIANPPYVRTQILGGEKSQIISKKYSLKGKVDLYYPFLINMTSMLKEGGIIGVITSNRYLTTKSGSDIRDFLLSNYDILEVIDLGDTKLFDAAVLPAIFIGRKNSINPHCEHAKFTKLYEAFNTISVNGAEAECESIYEILRKNSSGQYVISDKKYELSLGYFRMPLEKGGIWQMNTLEECEWVEKIRKKAAGVIGDFFRVKVGVKSCADNVFFFNKWEEGEKPESAVMRKMISQENISKWKISGTLPEVIYPYSVKDGKKFVINIDDYPKALSYLQKHFTQLQKREYLIKAQRKWYEYWVPQNPLLWNKTKIVFADISSTPRFAIDESGSIVNGNCYWIVAEKDEDIDLLYLVAAIANSRLMEKYHDLCFNNRLYSGKRRYLSQYVEQYPMPDINNSTSKKIIKLVKEMLCTPNLSSMEIEDYSSNIEELVVKVFD